LPFSVLAGVYLLLILISHQSFTTIMSQNIGFLKYQGPSISIPNLFIQYSTQVIFIYLIFPLIALIYCLFFLIKILDKQYRFTTGQYFLVFMAVFCLVISIRTIQRHTLSEGYNPLLFVPLLCLLPYYFRLERKFAEALFFTLYLCQFLILPTIKLAPLFYKGPYTQFSQSTNPQSRVKIMNDSQYSALVAFLENTLSKDQTFFDFTNAPMLYIFSNRMFPSYLIPNLSHTAETIQSEVIKTLTDLYNKNHVPVVIFKQGNSWDSVDNVPNEIRSYRIAEFIYKHYRPFGTIDNYQLWVDIRLSQQETENIAKANSNLKTSNVSVIQHFNVDKLPSVWANYDPLKAVQKTENQQVLLENDICKQGENLSLNLTPNIDKSTGNYLYLSLESEKVTEVQVILDDPDRSSVLFSVTPADELLDYIIRISSLWSWESQDVKTITLSCKDEIKINEIILKKGD